MGVPINLTLNWDKGNTADASAAGRAAGEAYAKAFAEAANSGTPIVSANRGGVGALGPDGERTLSNIERSFGSLSTAATRFGGALETAFSPIRGAVNFVRDLENGFVRLGFAIYGVERTARAVGDIFRLAYAPIGGALDATEDALKFRMAVAGSFGGMGNAQAVNLGIEQNLGSSSLTLQQQRDVMIAATKSPQLQAMLALGSTGDAYARTQQLTGIVGGLATLNPGLDIEQITRLVTQELMGNARSARQLGINPDDLAREVGLTSGRQLTGNTPATLAALSKYVQSNLSPDADRGRLLSVQMERLKQDFTLIGERITDTGGLFAEVTSKIKSGAEQLLAYVNSSQFEQRAASIGQDLGKIFDNLVNGGLKLLEALSGEKSIDRTPDSIAAGVEQLTAKLAQFSNSLPAIATETGAALHDVATYLVQFIAQIKGIGQPGMTESERMYFTATRVNEQLGYKAVGLPTDIAFRRPGISDAQYMEDVRKAYSTDRTGYGFHPQLDFAGISSATDRARAIAWAQEAGNMPEAALRDPVMFRLLSTFGFNGSSATGSTYHAPTLFDNLTREIGETDPASAFMRRFSGLDASIARIGGPERQDQIALLLQNARASYSTIAPYLSSPSALTSGMGHDLLGGMQYDLLTGGGRFNDLQSLYGSLQQAATTKSGQLSTELDKAISDLGVSLSQAIKGQSATYRADLLSRIIAGQQGAIIGASGGSASTRGLASFPLEDQSGIVDALLAANMDKLKYANLPVGSTIFGPGSAAFQSQYLRSAIDQQRGVMSRASSIMGGTGPEAEQARQAYDSASEAVAKYQAELAKATIATNAFFQGFMHFGDEAQNTLSSGLGQALSNVETHARNTTEQLRQMARSLLNEFNTTLVHSLFASVLGSPNGQPGIGNGLGGLIGAAIGGLGDGDVGVGFGRPYAQGGVASVPSIFGDGPGPEAAIPMRDGAVPIGMSPSGPVALLPGGRAIPAQLYADEGVAGAYAGVPGGAVGGGGPNITQKVFVVQSADEIFREGFNANRDLVIHTTAKHMRPGGVLRKAASASH